MAKQKGRVTDLFVLQNDVAITCEMCYNLAYGTNERTRRLTAFGCIIAAFILFGAAIITACIITKPSDAAGEALLITDNITQIDTVELGEYPQSYVGDELNETLKKLDDSHRTGKTYTSTDDGDNEVVYYEYEYNNQRYVKVTAMGNGEGNGSKKYISDGVLGTVGATYFFEVEPIVWDIFRQGDQMFAVTHDVLGTVSFAALGQSASTWQDSYLRYHLNNRFLTEAGIENYAAERTYYASTQDSDIEGDLLTDKVWTPSYLEIQKFYTSSNTCGKTDTRYCIISGVNDEGVYGSTYYFLRTAKPNGEIAKVRDILDGGRAYCWGSQHYIESYVPAFVLNETAIATIYHIPDELSDIPMTYNGTDQQIANWDVTPAWYNPTITTCTYTQEGETVTTVKDAGEYAVTVQWANVTRTTTLTVAPKELTVSGTLTAESRTYDRTRNVALNTAALTLNGVVSGESVNLVCSGTFADKNVAYDKPVTVTTSLAGNDIKNYVLIVPEHFNNITADITPQTVTITNVTVKEKEYDGTRLAIVDTSNITYTGRVAGDDLTVLASGVYDQADCDNGITVTLTYSFDGADAGNYKIANSTPTTTTGNIKQRVITVTINDQVVKVNDPQATLTARVTSGSLVDDAQDVYQLNIVVPTYRRPRCGNQFRPFGRGRIQNYG